MSCRLFDDLPIRILARDLAVPKLPMVASADTNVASIEGGSGQKPFGDAEIAGDPMPIVAVVDVGETLEARGERLSHGGFANEARAPGLRPARHVERAVIGEEFHDRIEIMCVECI